MLINPFLSFCLLPESQRLQQDLEKVQQLEGKITGELSTLKERVTAMETELHNYRDLDTLKHTADQRKKVSKHLTFDLYLKHIESRVVVDHETTALIKV